MLLTRVAILLRNAELSAAKERYAEPTAVATPAHSRPRSKAKGMSEFASIAIRNRARCVRAPLSAEPSGFAAPAYGGHPSPRVAKRWFAQTLN